MADRANEKGVLMFVKRFFEPMVAQASYLIGCAAAGEAVVIDANRDVEQYIRAAAQENLRIKYVTETHIHADYVSGSRELAQRTGASLCLSDEGDADWKYQFPVTRLLHHGDRITIGNVRVDVVHTPGHTPEHLTFLITDGAAADLPIAAVTGDFIFVGDVGRPDLLERAANIKGTMELGARALWKSLKGFDQYPDWLQIWPGHGAGSACGKGISAIPHSTLGYERHFNWAFKVKTEAEFVESVLAGQPEPPKYFATMKRVNKEGPAILNGFRVPPRVDDRDLMALVGKPNTLVVDTRPAGEFAVEHLPGTLNIPLNSSFVTWAGWLVPYSADLYLIADDATASRMEEVVRALALIGIDRVAGYAGVSAIGYAADHGDTLDIVGQIAPGALAARVAAQDVSVIDVRNATEWAEGHVPTARHIPLGYLTDRVAEIPRDKPVIVLCRTGARSAIAASVLQRLGVANVMNLVGGYSAWRGEGLPVAGKSAHEAETTRA